MNIECVVNTQLHDFLVLWAWIPALPGDGGLEEPQAPSNLSS